MIFLCFLQKCMEFKICLINMFVTIESEKNPAKLLGIRDKIIFAFLVLGIIPTNPTFLWKIINSAEIFITLGELVLIKIYCSLKSSNFFVIFSYFYCWEYYKGCNLSVRSVDKSVVLFKMPLCIIQGNTQTQWYLQIFSLTFYIQPCYDINAICSYLY